MELVPGTILLGKYRVDASLGIGGFGHVVRARHLLADQSVAIKILRDDVDIDEENLQRFLREAQAMVRIKSEHVPRISDVGTLDSGAPYVVMELLEGMDLGKLLETATRLPTGLACDLVLQACDVLGEAHALGIVHRDLKPTNLFVTRRRDGTQSIKVLDFGISKAPTAHEMKLTQTQAMLGTPAYMSPEQMRSARQVDARSDIWSLGVMLYELVEGELPFFAESFAELAVVVATEPPAPMKHAPELAPIIMRCLGRTPNERYPSVAELAADLAAFASPNTARTYVGRIQRVLQRAAPQALDSSPQLPRAASEPRNTTLRDISTQRTRSRRWLPFAISGAVVAAIAVIAIAASSHDGAVKVADPLPAPMPPPLPAPAPAPAPVPVPAPAPAPAPVAAPVPVAAPAPEPKKPAVPAAPAAIVKKPPAAPPPAPTKPKCNIYASYGGKC